MKTLLVNGKEHALVVLRVMSRDEKGRPSSVVMGYDDSTFRLDDPMSPNEFVTAFVSCDGIAPQKSGRH